MNPLRQFIFDEVERHGAIGFDRFMETALYHPTLGYYEYIGGISSAPQGSATLSERASDSQGRDAALRRPLDSDPTDGPAVRPYRASDSQGRDPALRRPLDSDPTDGPAVRPYPQNPIGRSGDFFTSVSVGPMFAELIAFYALNSCEPATFVEIAAHDGQFALDFLRFARTYFPEQFSALRYKIIEPSIHREQRQRELLAPFLEKVEWNIDLQNLEPIKGTIFSNEWLDAAPVKCFRWDAANGKWREWGVSRQENRLIWSPLDHGVSLPEDFPPPPMNLPDGYKMEWSPVAEKWWREAASRVLQGSLLTFDYGFREPERYAPHRSEGSLRGYFTHRPVDDLLSNPGGHDITASVDFSRIKAVGEETGLITRTESSQEQFFASILREVEKNPEQFPVWTSQRARQYQTLTHPEHLGRFQVLVQEK